MLPSPHHRPSQVFHESASSVWFPPKLPCEGVRAAICGLPPASRAADTNNLPAFLLNLDMSTISPLVPLEIVSFSSFLSGRCPFVIHLGFLFFHLEFLHLEYIWGSQDFFF